MVKFKFEFKSNKKIEIFSGVYFLFNGEELVYIGSSDDIVEKIIYHRKTKIFDAWNYIDLSEDKDEILAEMILEYHPRYNISIPKNKRWISKNHLKTKYGIGKAITNQLIKDKAFSKVFVHHDTYVPLAEILKILKVI